MFYIPLRGKKYPFYIYSTHCNTFTVGKKSSKLFALPSSTIVAKIPTSNTFVKLS